MQYCRCVDLVGILIKTLMMYIKPTYKYGLILDKGAYAHHFTYTGSGLSESMTEIPFSNNIAYLSRQWQTAAFAFPPLFYMTIDVRTGYGSETDGDSSQVIFRKLKNGIRPSFIHRQHPLRGGKSAVRQPKRPGRPGDHDAI